MSKQGRRMLGTAGLLTAALIAAGCTTAQTNVRANASIVGAWVVRAPEAPFPLHMFVFHSDGTVEQSNPDAGDPNTSDSNLMGVWIADGAGVRGKLVEVAADRTTHRFVRRTEISYSLRVGGDTFSGTAEARFYDADGRPSGGHAAVTLEGERLVP